MERVNGQGGGKNSTFFCLNLFFQDDAESGAFPKVGLADEERALMVLLDDPFGEAEAEAPAALLGGEAGFEDLLEVAGGDAFAGVGDVDQDLFFQVLDIDRDGAFAFHGVKGVFKEVFDHPVKQGAGDAGGDLSLVGLEGELNFAGGAFANIFHHAADLRNEVPFFEMGLATDLSEAVGYEFEAVDVLLDLLYGPGIDRRLL